MVMLVLVLLSCATSRLLSCQLFTLVVQKCAHKAFPSKRTAKQECGVFLPEGHRNPTPKIHPQDAPKRSATVQV